MINDGKTTYGTIVPQERGGLNYPAGGHRSLVRAAGVKAMFQDALDVAPATAVVQQKSPQRLVALGDLPCPSVGVRQGTCCIRHMNVYMGRDWDD